MWPFKWKLSAYTYMWCYLLFKISQNEIWKFGQNLLLAKFGSERVKKRIPINADSDKRIQLSSILCPESTWEKIHHEGPIQFISSETRVELNWNFGWLFSCQRRPILYSSYKSQ